MKVQTRKPSGMGPNKYKPLSQPFVPFGTEALKGQGKLRCIR